MSDLKQLTESDSFHLNNAIKSIQDKDSSRRNFITLIDSIIDDYVSKALANEDGNAKEADISDNISDSVCFNNICGFNSLNNCEINGKCGYKQ